jgi:REP element-mobilizing transposase RayT
MDSVFSQLYIQLVFAVKNRQALISPSWENDLYKYATKMIENRGHKLLAIGGMPDHIHIFIGLKPTESISELVREIKKTTNNFIQEKRLSPYKFEWQSGFGAFTYSRSHISAVCQYIHDQKRHHSEKTFQMEFIKMIQDFEVDLEWKKLFHFFE